MNNNKITGLAAPTANGDASTKQYIDSLVSGLNPTTIVNGTNADSKLVANETEITNGTTPLNMNSYKITGLASATSDSDAMSRVAGDSRYYTASTSLDGITAPAGNVSLNNHKITSLANATSGTDALNRQTGDARY